MSFGKGLTPPFFHPRNSLPNGTIILDWTELKAFADHKINGIEKLQCVLGWVKNMVGKEENAGYQHFLLYPQCFQKRYLSQGRLKSGLCGEELTLVFFAHLSPDDIIDLI